MSNDNQNNKDFILRLKISGIGPLNMSNPLELDEDMCKIAIYAPNGSGKTFISRCFDLLVDTESRLYDKGQLVNFSRSNGVYSFSYSYKQKNLADIKYSIDKTGKIDFTKNQSNLIFYVFNSDYVKRNFNDTNYHPSGNIPGTIVMGEDNITVKQKQIEIKELENKNTELKSKLEVELKAAKQRLMENFNIGATRTELKQLNLDNFLTPFQDLPQSDGNIETLQNQYNKLKDFGENPDKYKNILELNHDLKGLSFDKECLEILQTPYTKQHIKKEFLEHINKDRDFIQKGLELKKNSNTCPFCGQSLGNVSDLIQAYQSFFDTTQTYIESKLNKKAQEISTLKNSTIRGILFSFSSLINQFNQQKSLFSETRNITIENLVLPASFNDLCDDIQRSLDTKIKDITRNDINLTIQYQTLNQYVKDIIVAINTLNSAIRLLEQNKSKANAEIVSLRIKACLAMCFSLKNSNIETIQIIQKNNETIQKLNDEIKAIMPQKQKKEVVYELFSKYIYSFFGEKYKISSDDFGISLEQYKLGNPSLSLSEGEKTVIAFCYYLANTCSRIQHKKDYDRLFFIIDDPISSLDYNFVYITATLIKKLDEEFNTSKIPLIILTHHTDFMNLICSNNIVKNAYVLASDKVKPLKNKFILPHLQHLYDLYRISKGEKQVEHTTPNSMRQVIEYIHDFKNNTQTLDEFIKSENIFKENRHVLLLMHNLSHGRYKTSQELIEDQILVGCKDLISYIEKNFPGQVAQLKK